MKAGGILCLIAGILTIVSLFLFSLFKIEVSPAVYVYGSGFGLIRSIGDIFIWAIASSPYPALYIIFEILWL